MAEGLKKNDLYLIGQGTTLNSLQWQQVLPKPQLHEIKEIALLSGAYGIQVAHSGTVVGIMYNPEIVNLNELQSKLSKAGIFESYPYIWNLKTVTGGVEVEHRRRKDGIYKKPNGD